MEIAAISEREEQPAGLDAPPGEGDAYEHLDAVAPPR